MLYVTARGISTCKERSDGIAIATKSIASKVRRYIVRFCKKSDILMHDEKEKPTGVVAYLAYVRILWVVI